MVYLRGKRYENEKLKGTTLNQYTKSAEGQNVLQQKTAEKLKVGTRTDLSQKLEKDKNNTINSHTGGKVRFILMLVCVYTFCLFSMRYRAFFYEKYIIMRHFEQVQKTSGAVSFSFCASEI
jgi:hypothetical protein